MPLDTSIPLQVKPVQFDSPFEVQAKALQMKDMMGRSQLAEMQLGQQRDAMTRQQTLRDLYKGMPADLPETGRIAALRNAGFQDEAEKWEGAALKRDETRSKISKEDFDVAKGRVSLIGKTLAGLRRPNVTTEEVVQNIALLAQMKALPAEQAAMIARSVPPTGPALQDFLLSENQKNADADKLLESLRPKIEYKDTGKTLVPVDVNPNTNPTPQTLKLTTTPGQDQQASVTMRGQNMTDARAREKNAIDKEAVGKVEWKQDTNGNWIALPKEVSGTGPITPIATTAPGKRETQARQALDIINEAKSLIDKGTSSYVGAGVDLAGRAVGLSTKGGEAAAQLKALEGALMMAQPRMEGPQSDKDVMLYRQMAGQLGDPTVPAGMKKAAISTIEQLHKKYADGGAGPRVTGQAKPAGVKDLGGGFTLKN